MKTLFIVLATMFSSIVFAQVSTGVLEQNKTSVIRLLTQGFADTTGTAIDALVGDSYIQHNPYVADGKEALKDFVASNKREILPEEAFNRSVAEGDLVAVHYFNGEDRAIVDIFRFDASGKIIEHWDVIDNVRQGVDTEGLFGNVITPLTEVSAEETAKNKNLVNDYYRVVVIDKRIEQLDRFLAEEGVVFHELGINRLVSIDDFTEFIDQPNRGAKTSIEVVRSIAQDDLVFVHWGTFGPNGPLIANVGIWRVQGGKLVENWRVSQPVPSSSANDNGMF